MEGGFSHAGLRIYISCAVTSRDDSHSAASVGLGCHGEHSSAKGDVAVTLADEVRQQLRFAKSSIRHSP